MNLSPRLMILNNLNSNPKHEWTFEELKGIYPTFDEDLIFQTLDEWMQKRLARNNGNDEDDDRYHLTEDKVEKYLIRVMRECDPSAAIAQQLVSFLDKKKALTQSLVQTVLDLKEDEWETLKDEYEKLKRRVT